jgi:hypothetical protein
LVKLSYDAGLSKLDDTINCGSNGGYMQIGLAYLFGARRFLLVGYDMQRAPDGRGHWFGDHPGKLANNSPYATFLKRYEPLALDMRYAGCEVINCAPAGMSALQCFPCGNLDEELAGAH